MMTTKCDTRRKSAIKYCFYTNSYCANALNSLPSTEKLLKILYMLRALGLWLGWMYILPIRSTDAPRTQACVFWPSPWHPASGDQRQILRTPLPQRFGSTIYIEINNKYLLRYLRFEGSILIAFLFHLQLDQLLLLATNDLIDSFMDWSLGGFLTLKRHRWDLRVKAALFVCESFTLHLLDTPAILDTLTNQTIFNWFMRVVFDEHLRDGSNRRFEGALLLELNVFTFTLIMFSVLQLRSLVCK